jgi:hypothetical protein
MKHPTQSALALAGTVLCCMAGAGPALGATDAAPASAQELLQRWAQALGGPEELSRVQSLHIRSTIETAGLKGTVAEWYAASGLMRQHTVLGEVLENWTVFDGTELWQRDRNGKVRRVSGAEREDGITQAALGSFAYLVGGRLPVRAEPVAGADGPALRLVPEGGSPVVAHLDPAGFLPLRLEQAEAERIRVTTLADWREAGGVRFPFEIRSSVGDPRSDVLIRVEEIRLNEPLEPATFRKPEEGAQDYRFTAGSSARDIPFELTSNHIYLQARVNGSEPLWMLLDTGAAATVLNASRLEELGLKGQGRLEGRGAGEGSVDVSIVPGVSFQLPGVELTGQTVAAIPFDALEPYEGRRMDGVLGYDLLSRFVVEIDYAARRLHLHEAKGFEYSGSGEIVPIGLEHGIVCARATVTPQQGQPVEGKFTIDTGARSALSLNDPFVEAKGLQASDGRTIETLHGVGVGGEVKGRVGRVERLQLGRFRFERPVTGFAQDKRGALADPEMAGIIGGEILRRFTVIFDYGRERMIVEPNGQFDEAHEFDASGAYLIAEGKALDGVRVHRVMDGSPAAEAGVQKGDLLLNLDGKPAAELGLEALRQALRQPGREASLELQRGQERLAVRLKLRRLI